MEIRNYRGKTPDEMLHLQKVLDTDEEDGEEFLGPTLEKVPEGSIPKNLKKRLYKVPDLALVVTKRTFPILQRDLESMVNKGGVYYEVFDMANEEKSQKQVVVIFVDDSMLDFMAEAVKMKARLSDFDCRIEFKSFARERFEKFTGREV
jgi:hypothetical protein